MIQNNSTQQIFPEDQILIYRVISASGDTSKMSSTTTKSLSSQLGWQGTHNLHEQCCPRFSRGHIIRNVRLRIDFTFLEVYTSSEPLGNKNFLLFPSFPEKKILISLLLLLFKNKTKLRSRIKNKYKVTCWGLLSHVVTNSFYSPPSLFSFFMTGTFIIEKGQTW